MNPPAPHTSTFFIAPPSIASRYSSFRYNDNRHRARQDLRDRTEQCHRVRVGRVRILCGHVYLRTRPRSGIVAEEERATPRPHVAIRVVHAHLTLFSRSCEAAGGAQVILESSPL